MPLAPVLPVAALPMPTRLRGRCAASNAWYCWLWLHRSISRARSTGSGWLSARVWAFLRSMSSKQKGRRAARCAAARRRRGRRDSQGST